MADQKQLALLKQDVAAWNKWRQKHLKTQPDLSYANLGGADLRNANLSTADLSRANFYHATLTGVDFSHSNLSTADLSRAYLIETNLSYTVLRGANFSEAKLIGGDLREADLRRAVLVGTNLSEANLSEANLSEAYLNEANLRKANLSGSNLSRASLSEANLTGADLSRANLSRANLNGAILVNANLTGSILTCSSIHGISVWDVQLEGATQDNLIITPAGEPTITVDDLEVAQFIYLLLNHQKLRNVLNAVTQCGVLLLGRFGGGGLEVLQAVAAKLREAKYLPIIFDFDRPQDRNYTETVKTLAGLSRFIIADLSGPSVPQELYATVPHFKIPFVPILEAGRKEFAMAVDLLEYPWVIRPPVVFASTDELVSLVPAKIIAPAEEKHQARQQLLDELFPS